MKLRAPQRVGRDAEVARGGIDQPLDHIRRLRPPRAAIGIDRHGVGVDAAHAHMAVRDVVDAGRHAGAEIGDVRRIGREIGAHVGDQCRPRARGSGPCRRARARAVVMLSRPCAVAEEMLGAVARPICTGLARLLRGDRDQRIFAIEKQLGAEAAADIRRDRRASSPAAVLSTSPAMTSRMACAPWLPSVERVGDPSPRRIRRSTPRVSR